MNLSRQSKDSLGDTFGRSESESSVRWLLADAVPAACSNSCRTMIDDQPSRWPAQSPRASLVSFPMPPSCSSFLPSLGSEQIQPDPPHQPASYLWLWVIGLRRAHACLLPVRGLAPPGIWPWPARGHALAAVFEAFLCNFVHSEQAHSPGQFRRCLLNGFAGRWVLRRHLLDHGVLLVRALEHCSSSRCLRFCACRSPPSVPPAQGGQ